MSGNICPICHTQHDTTACPTPGVILQGQYEAAKSYEEDIRADERRKVIEELRETIQGLLYYAEIHTVESVVWGKPHRSYIEDARTALLSEPEKPRWKPKDGRCVCLWDSDKITWLNPSCPVHLQDAPTQYRDMVIEQEVKP